MHERSLLAAIERDPASVDPYLVLADELQAAGDPRGELIVLQHAQLANPTEELAAAVKAVFDRHSPALLGQPLVDALAKLEHGVTLRWRLGFLDEVRVVVEGQGPAVEQLLRALFASPSGALLRSLYLQITMRPVAPIMDALVQAAPPGLRELRILSREDSVGELAPLWARLPRLTHVKIGNWSGFDLGTLELPELAELDLVGPTQVELDAILNRPRPTLRRLHLDIKPATHRRSIDRLVEGEIPSLRDLGLQTNDGALAITKIPPGIEALSLEPIADASAIETIVAQGATVRSLRLRFGSPPTAVETKPIFDGKRLPALRDLLIAPFGRDRIGRLIKSRVLAQLTSVVLPALDGNDLQALHDAAANFQHLQRLTLLGPQGFERHKELHEAVKRLLPMLVHVDSDRLISGDLDPAR